MKYNMAVYVVGDFLRETRIRKGYTQEEVSYGICTTASLSRIENGAQKPGRLILEKLFERLGTENNLFNSFVSREEMELYSAIQNLIRDITDEDVTKLKEHISLVENLATDASELEHQCLYFAKGELARQKDKDDKKAMEMYMKAIHITLPDFDGKSPLRNNLLTFDGIMIINSISILYSNDEKNIMNAIHLDMWLKEYMENKIVDGKMKTAKYPMILYNLSCWLGVENCHAEALKMAEQGINFCIEYGNLAFFPLLILNKGVALAELNQLDEAKQYLHQAVTVLSAVKRMDLVKIVTDWCGLQYHIDFNNLLL